MEFQMKFCLNFLRIESKTNNKTKKNVFIFQIKRVKFTVDHENDIYFVVVAFVCHNFFFLFIKNWQSIVLNLVTILRHDIVIYAK